jgi:hypothetical protein
VATWCCVCLFGTKGREGKEGGVEMAVVVGHVCEQVARMLFEMLVMEKLCIWPGLKEACDSKRSTLVTYMSVLLPEICHWVEHVWSL